LVNVPEVGPHQGLATVPAPVLVDHHVVLARDKLVTIAVLSESVDVGSDGVGCTDQVQGTASPGLRITWVVIIQHTLAGVNPETLRYQERSTERVPVDALGVLVAAGGGLADAANAVITGHTQMDVTMLLVSSSTIKALIFFRTY